MTSNYKPLLFTQWMKLQDLVWKNIAGDSLLEEAYYNRIACTMIGLGLNEASVNVSYGEHRKKMMWILKENRYQRAFRQLKFVYLPIHWKVFFGACYFQIFPVYWLLVLIIKKIIQR